MKTASGMSRRFPIIDLLRNLHFKRRAAKIAASSLFDADWYLNRYPDVREAKIDPALHYVRMGGVEGRWPNPLFDPDWFARHAGSRGGRKTPLERYLDLPVAERPSTHPLIDPDWYRQRHSDRLSPDHDVLEHFLVNGAAQARSPHPAFDSAWYLARYPDVREAGANPLSHYLEFGAAEGRNPNPYFDSAWYASRNLAADGEDLNPLVHYLENMDKAALPCRAPPQRERWWDRFRAPACPEQSDPGSVNSAWHALERCRPRCSGITVIICVHNAHRAVRECLRSVAQCTPDTVPILVIDDASTDPAVDGVLAEFADNQQFRIERNATNLGYTRTVNHGLELAGDHDAVLLNSDTVVGSGWLTRMAIAAWREDKIGTVTAVSNNAGAFSVPVTNEANSLPEGRTPEEYARAVAQAVSPVYPETPTGNGFCMYIRRECVDETEPFDEKTFPRGYGEENDFCMRAGALGWKHIVDDSTLVAHARSASFGKERNSLIALGLAEINARYPDYGERVRQFLESDALREACERVREVNDSLAANDVAVRPRVLFVIAALHEAGGTSQTNRDLMSALDSRVESFLLRSDRRLVELYDCRDSEQVLLDYRLLSEPIPAFPHRSAEYDAIVAQWMFDYAIELVHVRHIALHGLGLIDVAHDLMLPIVFSFHDYYTVCPTVKLLDERLVFCGGKCTPTAGHCTPELWPDGEVPELKHAAVRDWQTMFADVLAKCDVLVTTSESARRIVLKNFPEIAQKPFRLLPHGRDFPSFGACAADIDRSSTIRILVPGNITLAKGAGIINRLASRAAELRIEIHVLGSVLAGERLDGIVEHGPYDREKFVDMVEEIQPHLGAVFSIWPETWCHTLTELWAAGVPVVGCDFGAVAERIRSHGGGWLLTAATPEALETLLTRLRQDPDEHTARLAEVRRWQEDEGSRQSCATMAERYMALYSRRNTGLQASSLRGSRAELNAKIMGT